MVFLSPLLTLVVLVATPAAAAGRVAADAQPGVPRHLGRPAARRRGRRRRRRGRHRRAGGEGLRPGGARARPPGRRRPAASTRSAQPAGAAAGPVHRRPAGHPGAGPGRRARPSAAGWPSRATSRSARSWRSPPTSCSWWRRCGCSPALFAVGQQARAGAERDPRPARRQRPRSSSRPTPSSSPPVRGEVALRRRPLRLHHEPSRCSTASTCTCAPGEVVALVGASGSGKSTVTALLPRFYDVPAGTVTVDGIDVRDVTLDSLRRQVGVVFEETLPVLRHRPRPTSPTAGPTPPTPRSRRRPGPPAPTTSSPRCPTATTPWSASGASRSRAASASASPWPGPSSPTPGSWCSTTPPPRSTPRPRRRSTTRCARLMAGPHHDPRRPPPLHPAPRRPHRGHRRRPGRRRAAPTRSCWPSSARYRDLLGRPRRCARRRSTPASSAATLRAAVDARAACCVRDDAARRTADGRRGVTASAWPDVDGAGRAGGPGHGGDRAAVRARRRRGVRRRGMALAATPELLAALESCPRPTTMPDVDVAARRAEDRRRSGCASSCGRGGAGSARAAALVARHRAHPAGAAARAPRHRPGRHRRRRRASGWPPALFASPC